MKEYYWNDKGHCTNDDTMNYKADGVLAFYSVAKNKHGWKHTYSIESPSVTICTPIGWNDEDVSKTQKEAVGEIPIPKKETAVKPQLSLF